MNNSVIRIVKYYLVTLAILIPTLYLLQLVFPQAAKSNSYGYNSTTYGSSPSYVGGSVRVTGGNTTINTYDYTNGTYNTTTIRQSGGFNNAESTYVPSYKRTSTKRAKY